MGSFFLFVVIYIITANLQVSPVIYIQFKEILSPNS